MNTDLQPKAEHPPNVVPAPSATLSNRSFYAFTTTQFLGAFNDNVFKQMILAFSLVILATGDRQGQAGILFALPFILFSGYAGQLAEMFPKTTIMRLSKIAELVIMALATLGFYLESEIFLLATLFLMGAQSAFFGPAKYGAIPELIAKPKLIDANGVVQMTTFLAIILGQALAGWLLQTYREVMFASGLYCCGFAVLGIGAVYLIKETQANKPDMKINLNPFGQIWQSIKLMMADRPLFLALIAGSFFFFSGAIVQFTVNNYGLELLDIDNELRPIQTSLLLVCLAGGIMVGCLAAGPIQHRISGKWTIFSGAVGVTAAEFMLYFHHAPILQIRLLLFTAGLFTGLYYVPIATFMQSRPPLGKKAEILAAYNFTNFVGILLAGVVWQLLQLAEIPANYIWWLLSGGLIILLVVMFPS